MIKSISEYLELLRKELAGSDAALIQDAVSDAEEHLRTALAQAFKVAPNISEADAIPPIIDKYGSAQEVAAAYRQMETRVPPGLGRPASPAKETPTARPTGEGPDSKEVEHEASLLSRTFGVFADPKAWGSLLYMLLALVTGIIYFTWVVTGISVSLGLMVLIVGIPLVILFLLSVRVIGFVEGRLVEALLGVRMPRRPLYTDRTIGWWQKIKNLFSERITWTALAYSILHLPLGILYFTLFVTLIATSLYCVAMPITVWVFNMPAYLIIGDTEYTAVAWAIPFF
ncbi:MAG: sensor domain-containing protein, partial [Chloroflexi bacterium]|nr:sensor domain-containing protein [Chloroflexota bacterium]